MTRDELIASLLHEAYNEADRHYCQFSADADAQLRELITAGVDRMSVAERSTVPKLLKHSITYAFYAKISASVLGVTGM